MNDRQLLSFITAVECGSFSKAEDVLFLSRQALIKQINSLEDELGFPLLSRNRQGIELTEAGEEFFKRSQKILAEISAATQRCKEIAYDNHVIRIENPYHPHLMLEKAFDEFSKQFPTVRQRIIQQESSRMVDDILNDYADLAECTWHERYAVPGISSTRLFPTPYHCLVSSGHEFASHLSLSLSELNGRDLYLRSNNEYLISQLHTRCPKATLHIIPRNDTLDIINVCYNNGIFLSKAYYLTSMQPLVAIPVETESVPVAVVIYRENPSPIVQEFLSVVQKVYRELPAV